MSEELKNRFAGAMVGLAVGDAIGTTVEFMERGEFEPLTDMVGGGPFHLKPGQWTDDTSMAICLALSLIDKGACDPLDQLDKYVQWWNRGYMSSTGRCFDIGNTTRVALQSFVDDKRPFPGPTEDWASGNGALMRLAPAVLAAYPDIDEILFYAEDATKTTHGSEKAIECSLLMADILASILDGYPKAELLPLVDLKLDNLEVIGIASGEFLDKTRDQIVGSGYCVKSLEAALWCFFKTESFDEAVLMAANLGDDADTTAAITGQFAGAYYGYQSIKKEWRDMLFMERFIKELGMQLAVK